MTDDFIIYWKTNNKNYNWKPFGLKSAWFWKWLLHGFQLQWYEPTIDTARDGGGGTSNENRTPSSSTYSLSNGNTVHSTTSRYCFNHAPTQAYSKHHINELQSQNVFGTKISIDCETTTILTHIQLFYSHCRHRRGNPSSELADFVAAKFYCLPAPADDNQVEKRQWISSEWCCLYHLHTIYNKISKSVHVCQSYSKPCMWTSFKTQCISSTNVQHICKTMLLFAIHMYVLSFQNLPEKY